MATADTLNRTPSPDSESQRAALEISRRLSSAGYHALRLIDCEYCDGVVALRGRVPTYYLKQMAQSAVLTHPEVRTVLNLLEVTDNGYRVSPGD